MLTGDKVRLRLVQESDLEALHAFHEDIANRGDFYPQRVLSSTKYRSAFQEDGFWGPDEGVLVMAGDNDEILGHIEFFKTVSYLDELELSYQLYSRDHDRRGIVTEAVQLLTTYLLDNTKANRIRLVIHPDNAASRRVAEKAGYTLEGVMRGAWYHHGRNHDVEVWSRIRSDLGRA